MERRRSGPRASCPKALNHLITVLRRFQRQDRLRPRADPAEKLDSPSLASGGKVSVELASRDGDHGGVDGGKILSIGDE